MDRIPEGIESRFRYVLLIAKRAEQLIQGSMPKIKTKHKKPTRIAMTEIQEEQIKWQMAPPPPVPDILSLDNPPSDEQ